MISSYKENLFIDFAGWFIKLADFAEKTDDNSSLPKLELLLRTGNVVRGQIIGYDRTKQEKLLMLLSISDFNPKYQVTLVPDSQVVALTFLDSIKTLTTFKTNTVISVLELKRTAKKVEEELEKLTSEKINLILDTDNYQENDRSTVFETVELLPEIFESLIKDEFGKNAVIENIKSIKISLSENNKVILENKELHLETSSISEFPNKQKERIQKEIESVL